MKLRYATVLIALALGACGTAPDAAPVKVNAEAVVQAEGGYNDTDVMYLQMMVAHHQQGLEMVELAEKKAKSADLKTLAQAIDVTQTDEVKLMTGWLSQWSKPTTVDHAPSAHADHGGLPATGPEEIAALKKAKGKTFETAFLNLFVAHQHNAVEMAHLETTQGKNAEAKAFADRVRQSRADQIQQMLKLMNA
ncbi:DUF305 domain-containing protein [Actinoplanes friuliensis]|uniref:DUF305 domain-containing protein n=1 Tax=Actinoplanes friuliensis DSM 7358 TaxID=1246995 RepID=U5WB56_9ACTN|nr:DUF305 domain-containing protein [Actinoplanes friuliensis]AGZ46448.1 hypothetical protein AFR_40970 [Actinoplanes friuliensis DSM 7358]